MNIYYADWSFKNVVFEVCATLEDNYWYDLKVLHKATGKSASEKILNYSVDYSQTNIDLIYQSLVEQNGL